MSLRQIVLDTETTGLRVEEGHRVIEIGCMELLDRRLTGRHFHYYINPEREVDAGALAIHGINAQFLQDKPFFRDIVSELIEFIRDAELIIHNAPFDVGFLNHELSLAGPRWQSLSAHCRIMDTLPLARQLHVGQRNSLDALCKRYGIDCSKRELHGALLDANLLAQVYLAMTGGQGSFFDALSEAKKAETKTSQVTSHSKTRFETFVQRATETETMEHENYLRLMLKQGKCVWLAE